MNSTTKRLVILISGTGATAQSVIDATRWGSLDAEVAAVFSHEPWTYGLLRAERDGIPAILHDLAEYRFEGKSESDYVNELADRVAEFEPDLVIIAGWKFPLADSFFERFPDRVVNLHAGVPGEGPVFDPYRRNPVSLAYEAYTAGLVREAQVAIEILSDPISHGRLVAQERVPIYDFDTLVDLEERVARTEQELLVNTLCLLLRDTESYEHDSWEMN